MKNKKMILMVATILAFNYGTAMAAKTNLVCPEPSQIKSTDFTSPSIWVAPPVSHAVEGSSGVGLGGKQVKEFLGAEAAQVNHHPGWVCVYRSEGGLSVTEYRNKIREIIQSTDYFKKWSDKVNKKIDKVFEESEPYISKYPQNTALGFIGYQQADN